MPKTGLTPEAYANRELDDLVFQRLVEIVAEAAPDTPAGNSFLNLMIRWTEEEKSRMEDEPPRRSVSG